MVGLIKDILVLASKHCIECSSHHLLTVSQLALAQLADGYFELIQYSPIFIAWLGFY
jgi:hypothetical protein